MYLLWLVMVIIMHTVYRMPLWIRSVFLHYLPAALLMRRPRKTRLRWMMEMPGMGAPPHAAATHDLPKHIR